MRSARSGSRPEKGANREALRASGSRRLRRRRRRREGVRGGRRAVPATTPDEVGEEWGAVAVRGGAQRGSRAGGV